MARLPPEAKALHAAADRIEPRLARAFRKGVDRMRSQVPINDLAMALQAKDVRRAMALLSASATKDALAPCGPIVGDAIAKGAKLGAAQVKR